ncbi:helix-turn-helix domain-containing protein [Trichloromonas acetexigens]|jgi:transcriptional regulator with XRE-family HTH domain|uniref:Helix-turn-helix transcriptional regulator n=1 Tax=Trichloromonas acetexigens TaxID=38815 RepID=A0A550J3F2_9BACT|nr:helix-turn-helix transcriptional regulator [Desulfuromonas acetexigens]TRO77755.1 helix-turn-helix transcriptional regulator [Desulfuromonas acetexigens]
MTIGERLKRVRGGLRQQDFAKKIGAPKSTVSRWERGDQTPSYEALNAILEAFPEVNPSWLVTGEGPFMRTAVERGKREFQDDELHVNVLQALIETLSCSGEKKSRKYAYLTFDLINLIAELREHLPSVTEIKAMFSALFFLVDGAERYDEKEGPEEARGIVEALLKVISGPEPRRNPKNEK